MPTKKKIGWAAFDWISLLTLRRFKHETSEDIGADEVSKYRYGGLDEQQRFERIFDPKRTDPSDLTIGFFDKKILTLPHSMIPKTEPDLLAHYCRMIDRRENPLHLRLMLQNFPGGWALAQHANALWGLREENAELFGDIVRGFHGQAIVRFKETRPEGWSVADFKGLLKREGLIWCAMDAQMAISGARVADTKPFGGFLGGTLKQVKGGTVLRLMRRALASLEIHMARYQTLAEIKQHGKRREKPKGKEAKGIAYQAEKRIDARHATKPFRLAGAKLFRKRLDEAVIFIRSQLPRLRQQIEYLETYNVDNGTDPKTDNRHRTFHQIWYSDLTSTVGAAVALIRFAMAEAEIDALVDEAFGDPDVPGVTIVGALKPPTMGLEKRSPLFQRTLDLLDSARRAQLDDVYKHSRTPGERNPDEERDSEDLAGLTVVTVAYEFLRHVGRRQRHADDPKRVPEKHQQTYWHLDVVPDVRLNMIREPEVRILG